MARNLHMVGAALRLLDLKLKDMSWIAIGKRAMETLLPWMNLREKSMEPLREAYELA